jgi:hypothetical protein
MVRKLLAAGVQFDEVIVFVDMSDTQDEAGYYRDVDSSGAVAGTRPSTTTSKLDRLRNFLRHHMILTNHVVQVLERVLVRIGFYYLIYTDWGGNIFDIERSAWTYRSVNEDLPSSDGYAPLGVEGGIAKEEAKMTLLWQELAPRRIPVSVVVYPWPGQIVHDTTNSRQVRIWRDWCGGRCTRFISLFPVFLTAKERSPRTAPGNWYLDNFVFGDVHYNAAGNALVADAVIRSLEAIPPVNAQPTVR